MYLFNYLEDQSTIHISVVDKDCNTVAIISTTGIYFGSMIASPSLGFVFNGKVSYSIHLMLLLST